MIASRACANAHSDMLVPSPQHKHTQAHKQTSSPQVAAGGVAADLALPVVQLDAPVAEGAGHILLGQLLRLPSRAEGGRDALPLACCVC